MRIEFDAAKDRRNIAKHGVSLAESLRVDWTRAIVKLDDREDYGEDRYIGTGHHADGRVFVVTFTMRGETMRVISMRRANRQEFKRYATQIRKDS